MSDFELPAKKQGKPGLGSDKKPQISLNSLPMQENAELVTDQTKPTEDYNATKPQYSEEELLRIFDEIIFSGEYSETVYLRKKVPITFRTRTAEEVSQIQKAIDGAGLNLISSVETMRTLMNLQYSLTSYNGGDLTMMKSEDKAKYIEKLSGPLVGMLITELSKFDSKIAAACNEGERNF